MTTHFKEDRPSVLDCQLLNVCDCLMIMNARGVKQSTLNYYLHNIRGKEAVSTLMSSCYHKMELRTETHNRFVIRNFALLPKFVEPRAKHVFYVRSTII